MKTPFIEIPNNLGKINAVEMPSQDVYWVSLTLSDPPQEEQIADDCYILPKNYSGKAISKRAQAFGLERGDLLIFDYDHGRYIIEYELLAEKIRYAAEHERQFLLERSLEITTFGHDLFPAYFGECLPPLETPCGPTARYIAVCNGIFFVETAKKWFLAICYPIWHCELRTTVHSMGMQIDRDREHGINQTLGFLFFDEKSCVTALYELLEQESYQALNDYIISKELLIATLWNTAPEYVEECNQAVDEQIALYAKSEKTDKSRNRMCKKAGKDRIPRPTVTAAPFLILPE